MGFGGALVKARARAEQQWASTVSYYSTSTHFFREQITCCVHRVVFKIPYLNDRAYCTGTRCSFYHYHSNSTLNS